MGTRKTVKDSEVDMVQEATEVDEKVELAANIDQADAKAAVPRAQTEVLEPKIYIGASFQGVTSGTVYRDGKLVPALEEAMKAMPAIRELVIPVSKLVEARKMLQSKDSAYSKFYETSKAYVKGER